MADPLGRTPVAIVTGFLGSGKTTLLNHLLGSTRFGRVAALVNDFGEINIDAQLIRSVTDDVIQLTNGCICCSINGNLLAGAAAVLELEPRVDAIVVEASGVADPLPVGLTFLQTELRSRTSLDAVVTVVDCANFALDLFSSDAAMAQIVHGDVIVLNKTDLVEASQVESLERRIAIMKPRARTIRAAFGSVPFEALLDPLQSDRAWPQAADEQPAGTSHLADDGFVAEAFEFDRPISASRFQALLDAGLPGDVFRAKGVVRFDGAARTFVFQLCGGRSAFAEYGKDVHASQLVFIGQQIDRAVLSASLEACLVAEL